MKAVEFDAWVKEDVHIHSPFGYGLFGQFFPLPNAKGTILILHGHTYTLYGSVKYMGMFRERGFNVLLMDNRFHGRSGGPNCTFGFREREDLAAWLEWLRSEKHPAHPIGLMGESLGAFFRPG
jgi:alpha-beta hydrolase superfamily lysophospholipase